MLMIQHFPFTATPSDTKTQMRMRNSIPRDWINESDNLAASYNYNFQKKM